MTTVLGKVEEFDGSQEEWTQYVERVNHFFDANDIADAGKKRAVLLSIIGPSMYALLRNLVSPAKPGEKSFDELMSVLKNHYNPTPSETVQRSRFNSRCRKPGESVAQFVAELRALAEFCNYGDSLEKMIRDRVVCGIMNSKIQQKLLAEKPETLKRAVEIAQGVETALKNAKELAQKEGSSAMSTTESVNRVTPPTRGKDTDSSRKFSGRRYCCGRAGHKRQQCRHKEAVCHGCGKTGHLLRACRNKSPGQRRNQQPPRKRSVHHVEGSSEDDADDNFTLYSINSASKPRPYIVDIEINGKALPMEIDTGASLTLVSEGTFKESWPTTKLTHTGIKLHSYSGESVPVVGTADVRVKYGDQVLTLPILVVKGEGPSLLGRNWLCELKLNWHDIFWLQNEPLKQVLEKYKSVLEPGLGKVTGYKAKIIIDPTATPKYCKARTLPYFYREKVEKELDRLVEEGTLEPVECSEWAAPIVAVLKQDRECSHLWGLQTNDQPQYKGRPLPDSSCRRFVCKAFGRQIFYNA